MVNALRIDGDDVATIARAAADALDVCTRAELVTRGCVGVVGASPALVGALTDLATIVQRCGCALERWCATTSDAVRTFTAVESGLAVAAALRDAPRHHGSGTAWPVTRLAPYLDDAGHYARDAAIAAGLAHGLTPAEAYDATRLPGDAAHVVARVLPEGDGRAFAAGAADLPPSTTTSVGGWLRTVAALPDGTIGVTDVGGAWVVSLPGIHTFGDAKDPMDLYGAARGLLGGTSAYPKAVAKALDLACVPLGASVMLVGHSQGGITAMDLASDKSFNGRRVHVTHVVTAGSPVSGLHPATASTQVLELDNDHDLVPQLDLRDSRRGTADGRVVAVFGYDDGTIGGDHAISTAYGPFADSGAFLATPGVPAWLRGAERYLTGGPAHQQLFALRDR
ncbi:MAG TPA: hypothetical protein VHE83_18430 [Mycobacteriales bacterium]|nr:hypothetical protein [Mycobacteriales bacterium]